MQGNRDYKNEVGREYSKFVVMHLCSNLDDKFKFDLKDHYKCKFLSTTG